MLNKKLKVMHPPISEYGKAGRASKELNCRNNICEFF
jgi:hypothetical protein